MARHAIWPASLLLALLAVAIGGPAACVIHCLRLDSTTHRLSAAAHHSPHESHHAQHGGMSHDSGTTPDDHSSPTADEGPSALTIGVVVPLALLPSLPAILLLAQPRLLSLRDVALLPPRDPPRLILAH